MKRWVLFCLAVGALALLLPALPTDAQERGFKISHQEMKSERRIALVIGNGDYKSSPLDNPVNDARAMSKTLREMGFDVIEKHNLNQKEMKIVIRDFGEKLRQGGVGLFYFAGHGMQVDGRNYLIPVNSHIEVEADVDIEAVDTAAVLAKMEGAQNRLNIVILDACRNNPFARSFRSQSSGLASINAPSGTLIAYATAPGTVAKDGDGENGTYTEALIEYMKKDGWKVEDVFKAVRHNVQNVTGNRQVPWESSSLVGDFYFKLPDEKSCPDGTTLKDGKCVAIVDTDCPKGLHFEEGKGCVPDTLTSDSPTEKLDRDEAQQQIANFYRTRGEWSGVFKIKQINTLRFEYVNNKEIIAHTEYVYTPVPGSPRSDTGEDKRKFYFRWNGQSWEVYSMGDHMSGKP